ncbi:MAG TPA: universal stress protein [Solirubrobacteraceae bacterium]|jgi:nucleotide-binding universal stress UspA family protein
MSCYRNILVALDGSADAEAAVAHASRLAEDQNARLMLLTVAPYPYQHAGIGVPAPPDLTDCYAGALRRAVESVPPDVSLTSQLLRGNAAETILRAAHDGDYDLIVMGSHGHGRLHRALLGSVSHRVLHDSPVPVLLIRHAAADRVGPELLGATRLP